MSGFYILDDDKNPVEIDDVKKWAQEFEKMNRRVAEDFVRNSRISTVFLGLDHRFSDEGLPVLFETMIFGGKMNGELWRYSTHAEALAGHISAVRKVVMEDRD